MNHAGWRWIPALAAAFMLAMPAMATASIPTSASEDPDLGTVRGFRVEAPELDTPSPIPVVGAAGTEAAVEVVAAAAAQEAVRAEEPPPRDHVGGFQLSLLGGVQLVGSASGQGGIVLGYFKPSTAAVGMEIEGGVTLGPNGEVYHGLLSIVLQSGARSSKIVPYVSVGGGVFRAKVELRDAVAEELPNFGIDLVDTEEEGALIAVGFGVRYYLRNWVSLRLDYREFRALTQGDGDFLDRLFALRRIGGMFAFEF